MAQDRLRDQQTNSLFDWTTHLIPAEQKNEAWFLSLCKRYAPYFRSIYGADFNGSRPYSTDLIRQYANGTQSPEIYRVMFDPQFKKGEYLGINFENIPAIIPRFRQKLIADIQKIPVEIKATAIDPVANDKRNLDKLRLKIQPIIDEKLAQLSKKIGYDTPIKSGLSSKVLKSPIPTMQNGDQAQGQAQPAFDMNFDFSDDQELALYMDKSAGYYSQDVEIAQELTIQALNQLNEIENIKQLLIEDAIDYGRAACRVYCDKYSGLPSIQYLDVRNVMVIDTWQKDLKKAECWAISPLVSLSELLRTIGDCLTVDDVRQIYDFAVKTYGYVDSIGIAYPYWNNLNGRKFNATDFDVIKVPMTYIELRSPNSDVYEQSTTRYGDTKLKKKEYYYQPPEDSQYNKKKRETWYDCIYKGYYIQGIEKVYDFGMLNNMVREQGTEQLTPYSLIYWRFDDRSLTERMIPHTNNIIVDWLKIQYMVLKALPPGVMWNVSVMQDIVLGDGGKITALEVAKMFAQTGSGYYNSRDEEGNQLLANANAPHMEMKNGIDAQVLMGFWQSIRNEMQMISEVIGLNEFTNAATPNTDALVGIQKMAVLNSQDARYYLQYGMKKLMENCATRTSLMIQQIAKYSPSAWNMIKNMVGSVNTAVIESMEEIPNHSFAIYLEDTMTELEKQEVKQFLLQAYSQGKLDLSDILQIYWIKNYKLLARLLNLKYSKRQAQQIQMQAAGLQMQQQQSQRTEQLEILLKNIDAKRSIDTAEMTGKYNLLQEELKQTGDLNRKLLQEITKLNISNQDKLHDHTLSDKEHSQNLQQLALEKQHELDLTKKQGEIDMQLAKSQPQQQPVAA